MFSILRPFLFSLDPETAHDLAIKSLKLNPLPSKMFEVEDEQMLNIKTQIGPIYVSFKTNKKIDSLILEKTFSPPSYDFESFDNSIHKLWCVSDQAFIDQLQKLFLNLRS